MRMWMVPPEVLCRKHLLGEHVELHMFVGALNKQHSIDGYVSRGMVEVQSITSRHEALALEMQRRGYNHTSSLPSFTERVEGVVDPSVSLVELARRCPDCRERITRG